MAEDKVAAPPEAIKLPEGFSAEQVKPFVGKRVKIKYRHYKDETNTDKGWYYLFEFGKVLKIAPYKNPHTEQDVGDCMFLEAKNRGRVVTYAIPLLLLDELDDESEPEEVRAAANNLVHKKPR